MRYFNILHRTDRLTYLIYGNPDSNYFVCRPTTMYNFCVCKLVFIRLHVLVMYTLYTSAAFCTAEYVHILLAVYETSLYTHVFCLCYF